MATQLHSLSSSDESDDDDSSTESSSPLSDRVGLAARGERARNEDDDGDQIRQHALQLLKSVPERNPNPLVPSSDINGTSHTSRGSKGNTRDYQRITYQSYQSYHDSPNVVSSLTDRERSPTAAAPWIPSSNVNNEGGISVTDVATLVFGCAATCIFEGYRAASNYLEGRSENNQHHYDASQRSNQACNLSMPNDGYQAKAAGSKEVMERGISNDQKSRQTSEESWDKVKIAVPASYQGR
jgi:hypothetical protein